MKKIAAPLSLFLAAALVFASCESDQHTHTPTVYNIVELSSSYDGGSTFNYYPAPGDTPVKLRSTTQPDESFQPGDCLFLGYTESAPSGDEPEAPSAVEIPIEVKSITPILNTKVRIATAEDLQGWDAEPIHLLAIWRAGEKIILRCLLTADDTPRHFGLLIDQATLAESVPTAYLYHRREKPVPNYSSQYYTAFSLAPLLHGDAESSEAPAPAESHTYTALRVRMANAANPALSEISIPL